MKKLFLAIVILMLLLTAGYCQDQPALASLSPTELKYRLEDNFGKATFCGPPAMRSDHGDELLKQFPSVVANTEEFLVILKHRNMANNGPWTDGEKLAIVNEHNRMSAISIKPFNGKYKFQIRSRLQDKGEFIFEGFITQGGSIITVKQEPDRYGCPVCLAESTFIDTPLGVIAVQNLQKGAEIWTRNSFGARVPVKILETARTPVPVAHRVVHLVLDDGRELFASDAHPTADGRPIGELLLNDKLDGAQIVKKEWVPYRNSFTYDILPAGNTGFYWANGILLMSTLVSHTNEKYIP